MVVTVPTNAHCPADISIPSFDDQRGGCIDVSIVDSFQNMAQGALSAGYHAMKAEARKNAKYAAA
jgi:hypothetical protein